MEALKQAHDLCELENDELDEYEALFVDETTKRFEAGLGLTVKQYALLKKLWERECR